MDTEPARQPLAHAAGPGAASRHQALRHATAASHRAVEVALAGAGSFAGRAGYGRYLAAIAPLQASIERALDAAGAARLLPDWPSRHKAGLIRDDLAALSLAPSPAPPGLPPALPGDGAVLGTLYVIEGATLGGAVLARRMARHGIGPGTGGRFLDPYGPDRGAMWHRFLAALEAAALPPAQERAMEPAAQAAFALFLQAARTLGATAAR